MIDSIIILIISGLIVGYFYWNNDTRKIERFYYQKDKKLFALLEVCLFLLILSLGYNARYIVIMYLKSKYGYLLNFKK
jgi:hypothetical protein